MDKELNINHTINIVQRKSISLDGIKKINSFDENEFFVDSIMGSILIIAALVVFVHFEIKTKEMFFPLFY